MSYKEFYIKQPRYFDKFRCIGGNCPRSCCQGWKIIWTKDELVTLLEAASGDLLKKIKGSFLPCENKEELVIKLCPDGDCPFHNKETCLCDLQKELGEDILSGVCKKYPRIGNAGYNILWRWCTASCPVVVDLLVNDRNAVLPVISVSKNRERFIDTVTYYCKYDREEVLSENPVIKYRYDIVDLFTDILNYNGRSIEDSVILGAVAARHISDAAEKRDFSNIPDIIDRLRVQLNNPHAADSLAGIKPNYQLKFKLVYNMIVKFWGKNSGNVDISSLHDGSELIVGNYVSGLNNFFEAFKDKEYVLKNIIINTFYELKAPVEKLERTVFDNYSYFVLCSAVLQVIAGAVGFTSTDIVCDFKLAVSEICCGFSHYDTKEIAVIDDMKNEGLTTPAHLALIIK